MPKNSLSHHLAALWFADIAGYSARVVEDERGALQLVEILQGLSRSTVQLYEGRVAKFLGVMRFSPNFQAQKWLCAQRLC